MRTEWYLEVTLVDEVGNELPCGTNYANMELLLGEVVYPIEYYRCSGNRMIVWPKTPAGIFHLSGQYRGQGVFSARNIKVNPEYEQSFVLKLRVVGL